jgi:hypothetical protein
MVYQLKNAGVLRDMMSFEPVTTYSIIEDVFMQCGIPDVYGGDAEKELAACEKTSTDKGMTLCMALGATEMSKTLNSMAIDDPSGSTTKWVLY